MDDPLLAWHEAFVAVGYAVESLVTNDITREFAAFGTLGDRRLVLWRGFNDAVNILVESDVEKAHSLVRTWQKVPSGGTMSHGWWQHVAWNRSWRFGDFVRNHLGFMQVLSHVRAVAAGHATVDAEPDRQKFMRERFTVAMAVFMQRRYAAPDSWLTVPERTPGSPRPA